VAWLPVVLLLQFMRAGMALNLVDVQKTAKTVTMYIINTGWCHAAHAAVSHFIFSQSLACQDMSHICIIAGTTALDLPFILSVTGLC
jgi:multidrug transporter EmrE-like cation transporter